MNSESEQQKVKLLPRIRAALQPLELLLLVTGTLTLLGSVLLYIAVTQQIQLMVWVEDVKVYPDRLTEGLSLPLSYGAAAAKDVRFATIRIANVGSSYIGEQQSLWKLNLSCSEAQNVVVLGNPVVIPSSTVLSIIEQTSPNVVTLALGVLESKSEITLRVMVVNPSTPYIRFKVTSSLPGVPEPKVGASLWGQFAERFFPLVTIFGFIVSAVYFVRSVRDSILVEQKRRWLKLTGLFIKHVLGWAIVTILLTIALGFLASWVFRANSVYEWVIQRFR